jgi:hypothetical protein
MKSRNATGSGVRLDSLLKVFIFCSLVGGAGVGYVWQQQQVHALGKELVLCERRLDEQRRQNTKLLRAWATLQSPRMLEEQVKRLNLGLGPPTPEQVWHVAESSIVEGLDSHPNPCGEQLALSATPRGMP